MNRLDEDRLPLFGKSPYRRFTNDVIESQSWAKVDYYDILSVDDYLTYPPDLKYTDMTDGMTFDLGGTMVEALWVPGHSKGCTSFLIKQMKILLSGCGGATTQVGETTIEDYRTTILKLVARQKDWGRIYTMHGPQSPEGSAVPLDVFEKIVATCDALLRGTLRGVPVRASANQIYGGKGSYATTVGIPGRQQAIGNLTYDPDKILNAQD